MSSSTEVSATKSAELVPAPPQWRFRYSPAASQLTLIGVLAKVDRFAISGLNLLCALCGEKHSALEHVEHLRASHAGLLAILNFAQIVEVSSSMAHLW